MLVFINTFVFLFTNSYDIRSMLGSSGQELLLWELRLVQERLDLKKKNDQLISVGESHEKLRLEKSELKNASCNWKNDQVNPLISEEECDDNLENCPDESKGIENAFEPDPCNSVRAAYKSEPSEISEETPVVREAAMDVLPQRSEVRRHYPVSVVSNNFETMHLSEESTDDEMDHDRFVRNGFGRISTLSSRSTGGAENFKVGAKDDGGVVKVEVVVVVVDFLQAMEKILMLMLFFAGSGGDHHLQECEKGS